eukprot:1233852-Prymnesium_polylepis.1
MPGMNVRSDHRPDSDDEREVDPHDRGRCGQTPNDWLAMGDREAMGRRAGALRLEEVCHCSQRSGPTWVAVTHREWATRPSALAIASDCLLYTSPSPRDAHES